MVSFPAWCFFRPRKSPQLPRQTRLCQRVSTRQVSARQSQPDELIRSRTTSSTTEATTKVTNCHSNIVIQSEVKLDSTFKAGATRDHLSQWAKLTWDAMRIERLRIRICSGKLRRIRRKKTYQRRDKYFLCMYCIH